MTRNNRTTAAQRARDARNDGTPGRHRDLLRTFAGHAETEALPVRVELAVMAPCADREERRASAQTIADALAHLVSGSGHRYPAAAHVIVLNSPVQARGGFLQLAVALEVLRDWSSPDAVADTLTDVRRAMEGAANAAWPDRTSDHLPLREISKDRWNVLVLSEIESRAATRGADPDLLRIVGEDSENWGFGRWETGRVVWEKPKGRWVPEEWTSRGTPFTPPAGIEPADNPYGQGHPATTVPFLLTVTIPEEQERRWGWRPAADAVQAGCRFLVREGQGWYRATASVHGPLPAELTVPPSSGKPTPAGYVTRTLMVCPSARRPEDEHPEKLLHDAFAGARATLADRIPAPAGFAPEWFPITSPNMAEGLRERLPLNALAREDVHPSLLPDRHGNFDNFLGGYPYRVVDAHHRGWHRTGSDGCYRADFAEERGLEVLDYDTLAATRGPLDPVVPPEDYEVDQVRDALKGAGRKAAATLLVAVHRVARRHTDEQLQHGAKVATLYAGREGSWETATMRTLAWDLGADLADRPNRYDEEHAAELVEVIESWTETHGHYTEVAANLAVIFGQVADEQGGWGAVADTALQGGTVGHKPHVVEQLRNWLLSTADCRTS